MAAVRTQKRASANAGTTATKRAATSRASSSRTPTTRTARAGSSTRRATRSGTSARRTATRRGAAKRTPGQARLTTAIVVATLVLAAWTIYPVLRLQYQHQREVQTLQAELSGLKTRNADLRQEVDELKTPGGVEQLARETLGLVKPGEQAYVVTGGVASETSGSVLPTK